MPTPIREREPERGRGALTVFRPGLGMWLLYAFFLLAGAFIMFVAVYERHPLGPRLMAFLGTAGMAVVFADLGVARVELDDLSVRIRGILKNHTYAYTEAEGPPEELAPFYRKPALRQRLAGGRVIIFPIWLGARARHHIIRRVQTQIERIGA